MNYKFPVCLLVVVTLGAQFPHAWLTHIPVFAFWTGIALAIAWVLSILWEEL